MRELLLQKGIALPEKHLAILDRFQPSAEELKWQREAIERLEQEKSESDAQFKADLLIIEAKRKEFNQQKR